MQKFLKSSRKDKLTQHEQLEFLEYLKNSLQNGFSLNSSIELMPALWPKQERLMFSLRQRMLKGAKLTDELYKLGFSKTTVTQIKFAMLQGNLVECLSQLTQLFRLKNEQIKKLKVELTYPFILAGIMLVLLIFMQTFVSSQFAETNEYTGDYLFLILIFLVIAAVYLLIKILFLLSKQDYQSLKKLSNYPIIGTTIRNYTQYLLVYDLGLLLASGFSLQKMCIYASKQVEGSVQQYLGEKIRLKLEQGDSLEKIIKDEYFLPDSLLLLLQTGSKRESLSKRCLLLGRSLFTDLTERIEKIVVGVQPFCFVLLGLCIVGMYLKLLLPMYAMMQGIN